MTKRTRTVFGTHANLAHVWAQQTYGHGYSADRRMFFEGSTIYSYGRHYAMARFTDLTDAEGRRVVLFKEDGYSVSTAKHRSHTRDALHGLSVRIEYVKDVNAGVDANGAAMMSDLASALTHLANPVRNKHVDLASRLVEWSNRVEGVRDFMRLYGRVQVAELETLDREGVATITAAMNAHHTPERTAKRAADQRKRDTAKGVKLINATLAMLAEGKPLAPRAGFQTGEALQAVELWIASGRSVDAVAPIVRYLQQCLALREQEALESVLDPEAASVLNRRRWDSYSHSKPSVTPEQWLEGQGDAYALGYRYDTQTLVRRKGERLETSRGAEVPFRHAVLAYHKATQCRREGATWHRNGEKVAVGVYQLDAIDHAGNIRAGCHTIAFDEMQRLAVREIPEQVRATFPVPALIAS